MEIMMEESFGPVIGIMKVEGDEEALQLMNDSPYGLVSSTVFIAQESKLMRIDRVSLDKP